MTDFSKLQEILDRKVWEQLSQQELNLLVSALQAGKITLSGGDRAAAIGGNADNAVIVTGDRNILISKELGQALQEKIQGAGTVEQQFGDRRTTVNNYLFFGNESANLQRQQDQQQVGLLLQQLPIGLIRQAYREALPVDVDRIGADSIDPTQIVADLQDFRRLPDFVQDVASNPDVPQHIREKLLHTIGQSLRTNVPTGSAHILLKSHLLIVLRPDSTSEKFRVNGWLIPDDTERNPAKRFRALDIDPSQKGVSCHLDQVPEVLDKLLHLSLEHLMGKRYELTIEIFLPLDYLCTAVDNWKIGDLFDEVPVGTQHRVVVRSCERLEPKYLASRLNQWYANWERIKQVEQTNPGQHDFEHLSDFCNCNWKRLVNSLTQKLGLKLTCGLVDDHQKDLFTAILKAATPIALWARCDLTHLDQVAEMDTLIMANPLLKLSEAVWRKRQQADEEDDPSIHLGAHLGILWEDPYRLTPDAMMQLVPPGQ
jgi:vWA-MoxR associated protein C-terminal domain